jgi:hypothetical protein
MFDETESSLIVNEKSSSCFVASAEFNILLYCRTLSAESLSANAPPFFQFYFALAYFNTYTSLFDHPEFLF